MPQFGGHKAWVWTGARHLGNGDLKNNGKPTGGLTIWTNLMAVDWIFVNRVAT